MQQKIIIIDGSNVGSKARDYLMAIGHNNIEIITTTEANKRGIDAMYHEKHEKAVSDIEIVKQYSHIPRASRADRRAKVRSFNKRNNKRR